MSLWNVFQYRMSGELSWSIRTLDTMKFTMMMETTTEVVLVDKIDGPEVLVLKGDRRETSL